MAFEPTLTEKAFIVQQSQEIAIVCYSTQVSTSEVQSIKKVR